MKAAVLVGANSWRIDDVDDPVPGDGELLIATEVSAICGSDIHVVAEAGGPQPPGFPGHESVGVVLESRSPSFASGDRVLCVPPAATARCFAARQVLDASSVLRLPAGASPDKFVMAQQLGTAVFAMKRFWPSALGSGRGRSAAVLGTGPAGLAFVRLLARAGFTPLVASDTAPRRLAAATALGASRVVLAPDEDPVAIAMALTGGRGVDLVIEAAGRDATRDQAMRIVCVDGRIGLFGLEEFPGPAPIPFAEVFRRRPTIEMAWGAQFEPELVSFGDAVLMVRDELTPSENLISHRLPLDEIADAFALAADPASGSVKVCLTTHSGSARADPTPGTFDL